jgi:hypothetical protein
VLGRVSGVGEKVKEEETYKDWSGSPRLVFWTTVLTMPAMTALGWVSLDKGIVSKRMELTRIPSSEYR